MELIWWTQSQRENIGNDLLLCRSPIRRVIHISRYFGYSHPSDLSETITTAREFIVRITIHNHLVHNLFTMKLSEIAKEAFKLPEEERASLASQLLHGLESPVYDVSDEEVKSRIIEADENPDVLITFDELVSGLRSCGN